jgi:hypothetical protein
MRKPNLNQLRSFYIHQLNRYNVLTEKDLDKLNTNELEKLERNIYHDKYNSHNTPEYTPTTY